MGVHRIVKDTYLPTQMVCSKCGTIYELGTYQGRSDIHDIMKTNSLCFTCAFWKKILDHEVDYAIVDGKCYLTDQGDICLKNISHKKPSYIMNVDFKVRFLGIIRFYGNVPEYLKKDLPNEGVFVSRNIYYKALSGNWRCNRKGCWDRYRCLRYDINIEKDGPWNIIPESHVIGDENCYSFIDKKIFEL